MLKSKVLLLAGAMALVGAAGGTALLASAQTSTTSAPAVVTTSTNTSSSSAVDTPESANDPADTDTGAQAQHHAPLGGDGVVSSINGSTIVMGEESDEGGASYTIDASKATVTSNGAASSLSAIKVGDKIFVQGTVNGTSVSATSVSLGHPGKQEVNDNDGSAQNEASEPAGSSDANDQ